MDNIVRFTDDIICINVDSVDNYIQTRLFRDGTSVEDLTKNFEEIYYISNNLEIVEKPNEEWAAIKTNRKWGNEPVFFFAKYNYTSRLYEGWLLGDFDHAAIGLEKTFKLPMNDFYTKYNELKRKMLENKKKEEQKTTYQDPVDYIVDTIYGRLLINNWKTKEGLARFVKIIGSRLIELREMQDTRYFLENSSRYAIVNTGLLDDYKEDIYILYQYNMTKNCYNAYKLIKSKQEWIENGFSKDQIGKLRPIKFYEDNSDFNNITVDDIDIPTGVFNHIILDNKERLDAIIGEGHSNDFIADRIREAINVGIKMLERDPGYVKPNYSTGSGLSWLMPLHIQKSLSEEPEFVMPLMKNGDFYTVKTVLPYNDYTKDMLTAVSLYGTKW